EAVKERLGLGVDPVKILADQQDGLLAGFTQEESFCCIERTPAPLGRIERLPLDSVDRYVEQGEQCRQRRPEGIVESEQLTRHLFTNLPTVVAVVNLEIRSQHIDYRQIALRAAMRDRRHFQN